MNIHDPTKVILTPAHVGAENFTDAGAAVARLLQLYGQATDYLLQQESTF